MFVPIPSNPQGVYGQLTAESAHGSTGSQEVTGHISDADVRLMLPFEEEFTSTMRTIAATLEQF